MNGKILAVIALVAIVLALWLFNHNRPQDIGITAPNADIQSEVSDITASQINPETGKIEYTLTAKSLIQNQSGQNELKEMVMTWTPPSGEIYEIKSATAILDDKTGDMTLTDGTVFSKKASASTDEMIVTAEGLIGNTKTRQIQSTSAIHVSQGSHQFKAQSMTGNLNSGDYEFTNIATEFMPPVRNDKALF